MDGGKQIPTDYSYRAVNREKTIFMKLAGDDFIIDGLFVNDIKTAPTKKALMDELLEIPEGLQNHGGPSHGQVHLFIGGTN